MKVNLYKLEKVMNGESNETYKNFIEDISAKEYILSGRHSIEGIIYELYLGSKDRDSIEWLEELRNTFLANNIDIDYGKIYNGLLIVKGISNHIYVLTFGHSYHVVQNLCDMNFALDFAESELTSGNIDTKSSDYIQSIKIRELVNVKSDSITTTVGGESYKFVVGKPLFTGFGKRVDCGFSIQFSKTIGLNESTDLSKIGSLIIHVEEAIAKPVKANSFPRIKYLSKSSAKNIELEEILVGEIKDNSADFEVYSSSFDIIGSKVLFNSSDYEYWIYIRSMKKETLEPVETLNIDAINLFFTKYNDSITGLDDILVYTVKDGEESQPKSIRRYLFAIIDNYDEKYIFSSGRWGSINERFIDELEKTLDYCDEHFVDLNNSDFDFNYVDEDDYIKQVIKDNIKDNSYIQLHKKLIRVGNTSFELADLYSDFCNELYAVKLGSSNQAFIYAFDQISSAVKCLTNAKDYDLKEQLIDMKLEESIINNILKVPKYSVVLGFEQQAYRNMINDGSFKLKNLRSLLLKLKIASWINFMANSNLDYSVYIVSGAE